SAKMTDRKISISEKRKLMEEKRQMWGMRSINASVFIQSFTPGEEVRYSFKHLLNRHKDDAAYIDPDYVIEVSDEYTPIYTTVFHDELDPPMREPTFANHRVPLEIRCGQRYTDVKRQYARQFKREIGLLIDNQSTAESAWQFVRTMAYTTLWPPMHSEKEMRIFQRDFCNLNTKEKRRYDKIMSINFT
ncbi:hypothetical protein KR009_002441, partial [Drosophila setifemur]